MSKIDEGITKVLENRNYSPQNKGKWLDGLVLEAKPNRIYGLLRKNVFKFGVWETPEKFDIYGFDNTEKFFQKIEGFIQEHKGVFCWYLVVESSNNKTNYIQTDDFYGPLNSGMTCRLDEGVDIKEYSGLNHYNKTLDEQGRYSEKYKQVRSWFLRLRRFSREWGISKILIRVISVIIGVIISK